MLARKSAEVACAMENKLKMLKFAKKEIISHYKWLICVAASNNFGLQLAPGMQGNFSSIYLDLFQQHIYYNTRELNTDWGWMALLVHLHH